MFHRITSRVRSPLPNEEQTTLPLPPASAALCKCIGNRWQPAAALPAPGCQESLRKTQGSRQFCSTLWRKKAMGDLHRHGLTRNAAPDLWTCAGLSLETACGGGGSTPGSRSRLSSAAGAPRQSGRGRMEESHALPSPTSNAALSARR